MISTTADSERNISKKYELKVLEMNCKKDE